MGSSSTLSKQFFVWHFEECQQISTSNSKDLLDKIHEAFGFEINDELDVREGERGFTIFCDTNWEFLARNVRLHVINKSTEEKWDQKLSMYPFSPSFILISKPPYITMPCNTCRLNIIRVD